MQTTSVNRAWMIKTGIYLLAMVALGVWGLYDGMVAYPNRGRAAAEYLEKTYLALSEKMGTLVSAPVPQPRDTLASLNAEKPELRTAAERGASPGFSAEEAQTKIARLEWLEALDRVGRLTPDHTTMLVDPETPGGPRVSDPFRRLRALETAWASKTPPKPLSAFDIPAQWLIAAVGLGAGAWILALTLGVMSRKYRWDPDRLALTLPGGRTIEPSDIREVDKRKWDKYIVFLHLKDGKEVRLDLLRYTPLEEWTLAMEQRVEGAEPAPVAAESAAQP
jgi:hypothetical protein